MKQVRFFLPVIFIGLAAFAGAQSRSPLVLAVSSATLYPDDQLIVFTLSVKNNTDSAVYFLKPDQALFEYDVEPGIPAFKEIDVRRPYIFRIQSATCTDTIYGNGGQPERVSESIPESLVIKLHPDEARIFVGLTATFDRQFCPADDYTIQLFYRVLLSAAAVNSKSSIQLLQTSGFEAKSTKVKLKTP